MDLVGQKSLSNHVSPLSQQQLLNLMWYMTSSRTEKSTETHLRQGTLLICLFYRPPSTPVSLLDELNSAISDIHPSKLKSTILLGDYNINLLSSQPYANPSYLPLQHLTCKFNLTQVVSEATRMTNNTVSLTDHD